MDDRLPAIGLGAFVDVETTGLDSTKDGIVELGIALFAFERMTGRIVGIVKAYTGLCDPGIPIPEAASRVHGIRHDDVIGKTLDRNLIEAILEQAEFVAAHNAGFDRRFVEKMFPRTETKPWYCSMNGINWHRKGFESKGLQQLAQRHNIGIEQTHRAGDDVRLALLLLAQPSNSMKGTYLLELLRGNPLRRRGADIRALQETAAASGLARSADKDGEKTTAMAKSSGRAAVWIVLAAFLVIAGIFVFTAIRFG